MYAANICSRGQVMGKIKVVYKCGGVGNVKQVLDLNDTCLTDCWILGMSMIDKKIVKFVLS
jgi:hypothetical protein